MGCNGLGSRVYYGLVRLGFRIYYGLGFRVYCGLGHLGESMSQLLLESSTAAKAAREELEAASCMPAKRRRAILDAAAWIRETIVVVVGHSSSLVRAGVRGGRRMPAQETLRPPKPQDFDDYDSYKQAVKRFDGQLQDQVVRKYMQLRAQDPNSAKRFVSSHAMLPKAVSFKLPFQTRTLAT